MNADGLRPQGETPTVPYEDLARGKQVQVQGDDVRLLGTICLQCDSRMIGKRYVCSSCMSRNIAEHWYGPAGRVYSSSTVHVSRSRKVPYMLAYVDLDGGVRVLAQVRGDDVSVADGAMVKIAADVDDWWVCPSSTSEKE